MTAPSTDPPAMAKSTTHHLSPVAWVAMAVGAAVTAFGVIGLLGAEGNGLGSFIPFFVGGALVLDLLVVPAAAGIGALGRRIVPDPAWPAVRAALLATATLGAFALPLVLDLGGTPGNPSLRSRSYGSGLLVSILVVWAVAAVVGALALLRDRRSRAVTPTAREDRIDPAPNPAKEPRP